MSQSQVLVGIREQGGWLRNEERLSSGVSTHRYDTCKIVVLLTTNGRIPTIGFFTCTRNSVFSTVRSVSRSRAMSF